MNKKTNDQTELPPKPEEPLPGECCGRGCSPCVYDYYEKALKRWQDKIDIINAKQKNKL